MFISKHNKQEVSNNEEEGLTIKEFSKEEIKLIKELKVEKIHFNTLEEQVQHLKIKVEEHKCIKESLQKKLEQSNREREALEAELVSLHNEVKKGNIIQKYANNSRELQEINNTMTRDIKREFQQKQQELDTSFAETSRITQQMSEAEIERKESN